MRRLFVALGLIALVALGAAVAWRMRPEAVPRKADALEQYFYARTTWFDEGFRAHGAERQHLLRQAVGGLQAVVEYFPEPDAVVTRALAEYDTGLCYQAMGETERARAAFQRARDFRRFVHDGGKMHPAGRDSLEVIVESSKQRLRELEGRT
jgi:hypothetical protein